MRFELRELARKIVKKAINAMLNEKADRLVAESLYECTDERELTRRLSLIMPGLSVRFPFADILRSFPIWLRGRLPAAQLFIAILLKPVKSTASNTRIPDQSLKSHD